jgi:uncharacterized membrane protein
MKKQRTSLASIVYIAIAALFASAGQIFFKFAANYAQGIATFILNPYLYCGGVFFGIGVLFMLKALRKGELTVIYPVMSTSFIWVSLLSPVFFTTDNMTLQKWIGIAVIVIGVTLIGKGRTK